MECGIANKCGRKLEIRINGRKYSIEGGDGVYIEIPENSTVKIEVASADDEVGLLKKIPAFLYRFFLSPYILFKYSEVLEAAECIGFNCTFEVEADENIILADSDNSFALCTVLASGRKYIGEMNYTEDELKKQFAEYIMFSIITILGSAAYLFLFAFFIKENRKYYLIFLSAASVLPIAWILYNSYNSYKILRRKIESGNSDNQ